MNALLTDLLAVFGVVLNALPQGLLALSFGFAAVPTAMAFFIGAFGNAVTGNVDVYKRQGDICLSHDVVIMDDEIHCDFVFPGYQFTSFMNLDEKYRKNLVLYTSPSKTFNVAGMQPANIIIPDETLRSAYRRANAAAGYSQGNVMGMAAVKDVYKRQ